MPHYKGFEKRQIEFMKRIAINQNSYPYVVGTDVGKQSLDVCLLVVETGELHHKCFNNNSEGYQRMKKWLKQQGCEVDENTLYCMEHTGIYTRNIVKYLLKRGVKVWLESSLHIKRSIGLTRGKDDKIDSERIATYAYMHQQNAKLVSVDQHNLDRINYLMKGKVRLEKSLTSLETAIREMKSLDEKAGKELEMVSKSGLLGLKKSIEKTKDRIDKVIESDKEVKALFDLITSVKSVGKVLATELIVFTHGFNRLLDAKKLACYSGVAPFPHSSGTSLNGKPRVSRFSNKVLKKTLHMCAMNAIRYNKEIRTYYLRKVEEGKNKMSVINAVRNKLIHTIVAVVQRGTPYELKLD